ncbi:MULTISPECIES: hypothetical protein [Agrobacterium]|uniref:hypothetical protein n=1 Tax=Agrobacterium TaxID=357 RepID=UPI002301E203|nr:MULTISPECIES: hypothetical protein [Agrobacterium]MDA5631098.1 hypothetical protein [Agrobacterium sp. ST15.16.055]MDA6980355.1 hypothetical protein [Agrobacterium salinitolerans]
MPPDEKSNEWSTVSENNWFSLAVASVVVGLVLFVFVATWVLTPNDLAVAKQRIDIVVPFATVYLALVTFSTIAWRGLVSARQADQQKAQNDANDDANYAKLLQEGAKLLGDHSKPHDQLAGLASLEVVINEPKRRFSPQALDVAANFYSSIHNEMTEEAARHYSSNAVISFARAVIERASASGMKSSIRTKFSSPTKQFRWVGVSGFLHQFYVGGIITRSALAIIEKDRFSVQDAGVHGIEVPHNKGLFDTCLFKFCKVRTVDEFMVTVDKHRFERCDFSGCEFQDDPYIIDRELKLKKHSNWYDVDNPPIYQDCFNWDDILIAKRLTESGVYSPVNPIPDDIDF